MILTVGCLSNS